MVDWQPWLTANHGLRLPSRFWRATRSDGARGPRDCLLPGKLLCELLAYVTVHQVSYRTSHLPETPLLRVRVSFAVRTVYDSSMLYDECKWMARVSCEYGWR